MNFYIYSYFPLRAFILYLVEGMSFAVGRCIPQKSSACIVVTNHPDLERGYVGCRIGLLNLWLIFSGLIITFRCVFVFTK
jgi:hypothetical protein